MSPWELMRSGANEKALADILAHYSRSPRNYSAAIELGVAYMWLHRWEEAERHFLEFIGRSSRTTDIMPKFAGTAMWCSGAPDLAMEQWKRGLNADYTQAGAGVTIPLHLYFGAVHCPDLFNISEMEACLRRAVESRKLEYPGVLGHLALGELDVDGALLIASRSDPNGVLVHKWEVGFWDGIHRLAIGDKTGFSKQMRFVANLGWEDFDRSETEFIKRIWSSEFFLARHHAIN